MLDFCTVQHNQLASAKKLVSSHNSNASQLAWQSSTNPFHVPLTVPMDVHINLIIAHNRVNCLKRSRHDAGRIIESALSHQRQMQRDTVGASQAAHGSDSGHSAVLFHDQQCAYFFSEGALGRCFCVLVRWRG